MFNIFQNMFYVFYVLFLLSIHGLHSNTWYHDMIDNSNTCPNGCQCESNSMECKHRLLRNVPEILPEKIIKLNLLGNRINIIRKSDFAKVPNLKTLQLSNNRIATIEAGIFDTLIQLTKLRLNRNLIQYLPDGLFSKLKNLQKLDLRDNQLQCVNENVFNGLDNLQHLYLDRNKIFWISEDISRLKSLEALHISSNKLNCNCHLAWLNRFIKHQPQVIKPNPQSVLCATPFRLSKIPISSLSSYEFQCASDSKNSLENICQPKKKLCSKHCTCSTEGIVKCIGKGIKSIPQDLPASIIELDLQDNEITVLKQNALSKYKNLKKILLNSNGMIDIEPGAFEGLRQLTSLYLNSNKLKSIRNNALIGLSSLMFLYIHNNDIECLPRDTFTGLTRLYLLHLSENKLTTLRKETLEPLNKLRYLYLVHNPLNCNCKLTWLSEFLRFKEASGSPVASCLQPKNLHGQPLRGLQTYQFNCGQEDDIDSDLHDDDCVPKINCPKNCTCSPEIVDCNGANLLTIPENMLPSTKTLILSYNKLREINSPSPFLSLPSLIKIDLSYNEIEHIDSDIFLKNPKLKEINLNSNKLKCINNQTFKSLSDLESLKLSDNHISCISEGSFQENKNIKHLTLNRNLLHCNCHLKWMSEWSRTHHQILGAHMTVQCNSPLILQGTAISNIDEKYFICDKNTSVIKVPKDCKGSGELENSCCSISNSECTNIQRCPSKCRCEATKVDCSQSQLMEIPTGIPRNTTQLYLDRNNLKSLNESSFKDFQNLKTLVLSYNSITELNQNVLTPLKNLETLLLSFNKLQCIHQHAFKGLINLKVLILQSNDISTIPFETFQDLRNLNNIALGQNPFHCDCNIKWLNQFFLERFLDNGISLCASPENMKLKSIYHSKPTEFSCSDDTDDTYITAKCDACIRRPCKHNGKCTLITHHTYSCQCPHPFHGQNCEKKINACFGNPCKNEGICKNVDNFGNYECVCPMGFRGPKCVENIDDCVNNKCENDAPCEDSVNGYSCRCKKGYRGKFCEQKFSYCTDLNPCNNSGVCQSLENNDYKCICSFGWFGKNCDENKDDCKYNECRNKGQCVDLIDGYECKCRPGYIGKLCDEPAWKPAMLKTSMSRRDIKANSFADNGNESKEVISESVCAYHQCLHDGICVSDLNGEQKSYCRCKPGYSGQQCQHLDSLYFSKESFIEISPPSRGFLMPRGNITLNFLTNSSSGLLLYQGLERTYLSVNLYRGHVRIGYNIGDKVIGPEGYSMTNVNDSRSHSLEIEIIGENLTMYLDRRFHCTLKSSYSSGNRYLALNTGIFIGGAPKDIMETALSKYHLESNTDFVGCLQSLWINQKKMDLLKVVTKSVNVQPGCKNVAVETYSKYITQTPQVDHQTTILTNIKNGDVCDEPEICKNGGVCQVQSDGKKKYKCNCQDGFAGKSCNRKAYMCRRKMIKNHIKDPDTTCLSLRRVRYRYCEGACVDSRMQSDIQKSFFHKPVDNTSSRCCQPYKFRTRRIEFKCDNGRQYIRGVHFVRRCKCLPNCASK